MARPISHHLSPPRWRDDRGAHPGHVVACACGFTTPPQHLARQAVAAGDVHIEHATRHRTRLLARLVHG